MSNDLPLTGLVETDGELRDQFLIRSALIQIDSIRQRVDAKVAIGLFNSSMDPPTDMHGQSKERGPGGELVSLSGSTHPSTKLLGHVPVCDGCSGQGGNALRKEFPVRTNLSQCSHRQVHIYLSPLCEHESGASTNNEQLWRNNLLRHNGILRHPL